MSKKTIVGITGIFGSGKSTVSKIFKSYGSKIIDADKIAHKYLARGTKTYKEIVGFFGSNILKGKREIDRVKLGRIVFGNKKLLSKLNSIIHPRVISEIRDRIKQSRHGVVVLDVPLLLEAGLKRLVDDLIVVIIDRDELIRRLVNKTALRRSEILKRIRSQIPLRKKKRVADFIIDNSKTIRETKKQIKRIIGKIQGGSCGEIRD
ncbi:MAG: dephospho-CoA kinase [Candidatus Omnitrophica bacterium]|nr:dephospho-CoA kinase [Candidatus Omnitrophota bacterium]